jgi:hypothetical protein
MVLSKVVAAIPFLGNSVGGRMATASHYKLYTYIKSLWIRLPDIAKRNKQEPKIYVRINVHLYTYILTYNYKSNSLWYNHMN